MVKQRELPRRPAGCVANGSRLGEAECATNPPTRWDERQTGREVDALLALAEAMDAAPR